MFAEEFAVAGPLMWGVFAAWCVVLAGILDRGLYLAGRCVRRPGARVAALAARGERGLASQLAAEERERATRGCDRIDAVSQLATSVGLFGTVTGLAQSFLSRGDSGAALASPEAIAAGLSTALYTTVGGLAAFLVGQVFLVGYREWLSVTERGLAAALEPRLEA